ncbi:MAG: hypothetical protein ABJD53_05660 [Gammaproteobacteria bacterium]
MSAENSKSSQNPRPAGADAASASDTQSDAKSTGRLPFEDKGNAVWEGSAATRALDREVSIQRLQKLQHPSLSLAEDSPTPFETVRPNPLGAKKGYDPYDSGKLGKRPVPVKKDLRKLSEFLRLKKQAANNKGEE